LEKGPVQAAGIRKIGREHLPGIFQRILELQGVSQSRVSAAFKHMLTTAQAVKLMRPAGIPEDEIPDQNQVKNQRYSFFSKDNKIP